MNYFNRTVFFSITLRKFVCFFLRHIYSFILLDVTLITEMSRAPAEPRCYWAAEFTLILYIFSSMFQTVGISWSVNISAFSTNKFFFFKNAIWVIILSAISQAAEIRIMALVTQEETKLTKRIGLRFLEELVLRIEQSFVLFKTFYFQPLQGFSSNLLIQF